MAGGNLDPTSLLAGASLLSAALAAYSVFVEPVRVDVSKHRLPVPDLPEGWRGARLVHLTDIHYGDPRSDRLFRWMVDTVNALSPDLIVITGDFIVRYASEVDPCARYLAELKSRHGVLAVLGDHDYNLRTLRTVRGLPEAMSAAGVRLLRNEGIELPGGLRLAGTDPTTLKMRKADLNAALAGMGGAKPHILLTHSPDMIGEAAKHGLHVVLCGHTHGGQVVAPFYGPPVTHTRVGRRFASGWSELKGTRMYTCRGLASHCSLRFLCRPEVAVFTLEKAF